MRIKLDLLNVSSKPLLRVDTGNLSETCGMSNAENKCLSVGYQLTHTVRWRTSSNGTKAYPTIHTYLLLSLTGDCLNQNARKGYVADTENLAWQRSFHSSPRTLKRQGKP